MSMQGYVIRTVSTFDDSMLRRDANNEMEDPEDKISPRGAMEFPEAEASTQKNLDKKNTSMTSKSPTSSSSLSLKRNLSDSQLVAQISKSMHTWKCSLCFHDNLNTMNSTCAMCGTHMDASFMAALNALDNLKDPSVHNDEENLESERSAKSDDGDQDRLFPASFADRDGSFRTADEDATFVSFQTAQQSVNMRADISTINPETVGTSIQCDGSMEDKTETEQEKENRSSENSSNKSDTSGKVQSNTSVRDTVLKLSQSLMDISVNSSITMLNQNSTFHNASIMLIDGNEMQTSDEMQASDAAASKTTIDSADDSIHTLLNVTRPEEDDEFDPMLFQNDDVIDAESLCDRQDEGELQGVEYAYETAETPIVETTNGHPFGFEKEIQLDEYIQQQSQDVQWNATEQSFDIFPYVAKTESASVKVGEKKSKSQVQIEVSMGDEEGIVQEQESFVDQNIWRIRKTVAVTVATIVLVSIFALA
mmetsp:Transcript_40972/g.98807  ORF Transcript_40972/g.98807 Transcript_40972/m.98807 type:complete len:479 (-) Transcript_40972:181-1617(-)